MDSQVTEKIKNLLLENKDQIIETIASVETLAFRFKGAKVLDVSDEDYDVIREAYRIIGQDDFLE